MVHKDFFLIAIKDMKKKKFSTLLTVFAISLGILSIYVILSINQNFNTSIQAQLDEFGADKIFILKTGGSDVSFDDQLISELERTSNVEKIYGYALLRIQFQNGREFERVQVLASELSEDFFEDNTIDIERGKAPSPNSDFVIVMGQLVAEEGFDKELDIGQSLSVGNVKFKIVGIAEELGSPQDDSTVYMQYDVLNRFKLVDDYDRLAIIATNPLDIENTKLNLEIYFEREFGENKVDVLTSQDLLDQLNQVTGLITAVLGGIGFVSLIVGALGVINTMFVIVTEKIKEIGILKSVGATNQQILLLFMFQSALFGILGALFGVLIGSFALIGIGAVLENLGYSFLEVQISYIIIAQMVAFGAIVGAVAGFIPSYIASRMNVVDALRK